MPLPVSSRFRLIEKQGIIEYGGDIKLIFIELPKFNLTEQQPAAAVLHFSVSPI